MDVEAWQDGAGGQDTGGSSGLVRGTAGYMRLRKESLVCLFTCHRRTQLCSHTGTTYGVTVCTYNTTKNLKVDILA